MNSLKELAPAVYDDSGVSIKRDSIRAPHGRCFSLHWHDRIELLRVKEGCFDLWLGETHAACIHPGEVGIVAPRQPHTGIAGVQGVVYDVVMFEVDAFYNAAPITSRLLRPLQEGRMDLRASSSSPELVSAVDAVIAQSASQPLLTVGGVYRLLAALWEDCSLGVREPAKADLRFASVVEYVSEHFADPLSTAGLSRLFGYDEAYFCRRFKKLTGLTVLRYIEVLRLEAAQKLLLETDTEISQIALQCGFGDVCYFSHRFRKHAGQPPSAFRKGM